MATLLVTGLNPVAARASSAAGEKPAYPLLNNEECWRHLPPAESGSGQPLPTWARALAAHLPGTTAALLRLDFLHRAHSPLDPKLRAQMRWVAAHANRCAYTEAQAAFDARQAGVTPSRLDALPRGEVSGIPSADRRALEFARKMTLASSMVTDDEFVALVKDFGEKDVVAMVLLLAYANFQDRLVTCLGSPPEPEGPRPPLEVVFHPGTLQGHMPGFPRSRSELGKSTGKDQVEDDPAWARVGYDELQARMERQRNKTTRVRVPTWDEVARGLPPDFPSYARPVRIVWTLVCLGYQPELAAAWETLMRAASAESLGKYDRAFSQSLFWVVTRTVDCPYCMGHCEMNWEVAGLSPPEIAARSRVLVSDDWSAFPPREQQAFAFARKLTRDPGSVSGEDVRDLVRDFGAETAINILVYASRCNYMVRVSNGFQLSLERDNVFFDYYVQPPAEDPSRSTKGSR
jgi:alkylhydroperoxidase family enzyme